MLVLRLKSHIVKHIRCVIDLSVQREQGPQSFCQSLDSSSFVGQAFDKFAGKTIVIWESSANQQTRDHGNVISQRLFVHSGDAVCISLEVLILMRADVRVVCIQDFWLFCSIISSDRQNTESLAYSLERSFSCLLRRSCNSGRDFFSRFPK